MHGVEFTRGPCLLAEFFSWVDCSFKAGTLDLMQLMVGGKGLASALFFSDLTTLNLSLN